MTTSCDFSLNIKFESIYLENNKVKAKMAEDRKFRNERRLELGTIEGDVEIRDCDLIVPQQGDEIVVSGTVKISGETTFEGSLRCGKIESKSRDTITVNGNLHVQRTVDVPRGSLRVAGHMTATEVEVGAALSVGGNLECTSGKAGASIKVSGDAKASRLTAGGSVKIEGTADVERINGGGSVVVGGRIKADEFDAGGSGKCSTGLIQKVSVGGSFKAVDAIEIVELDVGGTAKVGSGSSVQSVDVGGSFKGEGDLEFGDIDVGGTVKIEGNGKGKTIDVGGTVKVGGDLDLEGGIEVGGTVAVHGSLKCGDKIKVGGTVKVDGRIDTYRIIVGGEIDAEYIKATGGFRLGRRGEVRGFVESTEILIRERARTDSLYGEDIRIEERARVGSLYGKSIYIERDAVVEGELLYTDSLDAEDGVTFRSEPKKVDSLPRPEEVS